MCRAHGHKHKKTRCDARALAAGRHLKQWLPRADLTAAEEEAGPSHKKHRADDDQRTNLDDTIMMMMPMLMRMCFFITLLRNSVSYCPLTE